MNEELLKVVNLKDFYVIGAVQTRTMFTEEEIRFLQSPRPETGVRIIPADNPKKDLTDDV